jgi:hypothetical protein
MAKKRQCGWGKFRSFKERGEWVELLFMAAAACRGYLVLKPWGDSRAYDVGIEVLPGQLLRVQVKSTTRRRGTGYCCQLRRGSRCRPYSLDDIDVFAAYVVEEKVWYVIPAKTLLGKKTKDGIMLCPVSGERHRCKYEQYREAWVLLGKTREELAGW